MFNKTGLFFLLIAIPLSAFAEQVWITFLPEYPEGTAPLVNVLISDEEHAIVEVTTPGMWVEEIEEGEVLYHALTIPECLREEEPGMPSLPHIGNTLAAPGEKGIGLDVLEKTTLTLEDYLVWPAQFPQLWGELEPPFYRNDYFYTADYYYPPNEAGLGGANIWRDLRVVNPAFYPIRFNPAQGLLEVAYYLKYELTFAGPSEDNVKPDPDYPIEKEYADGYREAVINYDYLQLPETGWDLGEESYIIITRQHFLDEIQPLVYRLIKRGFSVVVLDSMTLEGGNSPASIKNAIKKGYEGKRTKYVLLVGHAVPGGNPDYYIPTAICKPEYTPWYWPDPNDDIASDYWYSLLKGDDYYPEVAVGRIWATSEPFLANAVDKIINYETCITSGSWPKNCLLVADDEWFGWMLPHEPYEVKEWIREHNYQEPPPDFITCYGKNHNTNEDVANVINSGCGIVNYLGHADINRWAEWNDGEDWKINPNMLMLANDGKTPVVFNFGCNTAKIDGGANITSAWLYISNAGVAGIGASRLDFADETYELDYYLFLSIFDHKRYRIGDALNHAKVDVFKKNHEYPCIIPGKELDTAMMFLLIGEPSMLIRTGESLSWVVNHVASVAVGSNPIQVEVLDEGAGEPIENALVCLYKEGEVHEAYTTAADGLVSFDTVADSEGEITVTVTKHGYIPDQSTIDVTAE